MNFLFWKDYVVCNEVILGQSRRTPFTGRQRKIVSNIAGSFCQRLFQINVLAL